MQNIEIRSLIMKRGLRMYKVAEAVGVSETYFSKLFRKELSQEWRDRIIEAIERMSVEEK